jgi:ferric-dicitrate binding protein FerR (iron transport regulator)
MALRVLQGLASKAEKALVEAWRQESSENALRFRALQRVWLHTGEALETESGNPPDLSQLLARAGGGSGLAGEGERRVGIGRKRPNRFRSAAWAAAASLALFLGGYLARAPRQDTPDRAPAVREVTTGGGEMVTVSLEDGTVVRLAPESRLEIRRGVDRQVFLDGRAFFSVASDAAHPFHVRTAGGDVAVLGTRFEVAARNRDVRVLVVEGKVELSTGGNRVELSGGTLAEVLAGGHAAIQTVDDVLPHLAWLGRTLVFQDTPFRDVAREVEDRFGVRLQFETDDLASRRITAAFTDEELEEVLRVLCRAAGARCTRTGPVVLVAPRTRTIKAVPTDDTSPDASREEREP